MTEELTIRQIIENIQRGQIRVPTFQRGFVWDANKVAYLMDSIFKGYPFGSLLFWRTREPLKSEKQLGPFRLPDSQADFPIDYVLDGQQRITSIFGVFQTELDEDSTSEWTKVYYDYTVDPSVNEPQFVALSDEEVDIDRHFPLKVLFDTTAYRKATRKFSDELAEKIDKLQTTFREARIPIQTITTEDRATVAIIFERINRMGVELDTLQLLSAWTWSEDFVLQDRFRSLGEELSPFGFKTVGEEITLLLRCCAAIIVNEATPEALVNISGSIIRERFEEIENGIKGAIDFLKNNLNVQSLNNLPFATLLVPLSAFFSIPGKEAQVRYDKEQFDTIIRWFWKSCFSKRYSSGVIRNIKTDINEMIKLKNKQDSMLDRFNATITPEFFKEENFRIGSVNTTTFVLMLAQKNPLSFISGSAVSLRDVLKEYNRNEFHHIYPKSFLNQSGQTDTYSENCFANFCFLSKSDNNQIGGSAPSKYRKKMPENVDAILEQALCPPEIFLDEYTNFINKRAIILSDYANGLMR